MKTQTGFLGFFDILGYQSLLVNNDPNVIAENVLSQLTTLNKSIGKKLADTITSFDETVYHEIYKKNLKWLVFSDTILISLDVPSETTASDTYDRLLIFLLSSIILQQNLLLAGLPLRGALTFGDYLIKDACFAGRPIIEAYALAEKLELSACVVAPSAKKMFVDILETGNLNHKLLLDYMVPLKNSESLKLLTLNYGSMEDGEDPRDIVFKSFFAHNKDIPEKVQQKILNTEQHLRFLDIYHKTK